MHISFFLDLKKIIIFVIERLSNKYFNRSVVENTVTLVYNEVAFDCVDAFVCLGRYVQCFCFSKSFLVFLFV